MIKMKNVLSNEPIGASYGWPYIMGGIVEVGAKKLMKTIPLGKILTTMSQYYLMEPVINEKSAKLMVEENHLKSFKNHRGNKYTVMELFELYFAMLMLAADFTLKERVLIERAEQHYDFYGIMSMRVTGKEPEIQTVIPDENLPYKKKLETRILLGDAMNVLSYYANDILYYSDHPTSEKLFYTLLQYVAYAGGFSDEEYNNLVRVHKSSYRDVAKALNRKS